MKRDLEAAIADAVREAYDLETTVDLTHPDEKFGDYATNVALKIAKNLQFPPREIAEKVRELLLKNLENTVSEVSIAGPGFINIKLSDKALWEAAESKSQTQLEDQSVVIETNNPNPFKAIHIGHAFNAILADSIANLVEKGGARTYRVSYHGDVGLHVGKSMYSLLRYVDGDSSKLEQIKPEERNTFMSKMYAEGSKAYKEDESAKQKIDELAKQSFTREDPVYAAVYEAIFNWSFEQIDEIVARLGNKPTERRFLESDAEVRGVKIVKDNVPKVFQESDGALVFKGSDYGSFDNAFVSKRGTGLYAARDLGLIQLKNEQYHPNKSYIVTAEEQRAYFKGVIAAAELCMPDQKGVTVNIPHGTVKLTTGKMSSRDGDVVEVSWLFDVIAEAIAERGGEATPETIIGALRYEFLRIRVGGDVVFDINEAVSVQGNSGPYLQYAHARACSILNKSELSPARADDLEEGERSLVRKIAEYPEVIDRAVAELMPHYVATYLYELAQVFNHFYEHNRVIGDAREPQRLALVEAYANTLKSGLDVLGIPAPDRM